MNIVLALEVLYILMGYIDLKYDNNLSYLRLGH